MDNTANIESNAESIANNTADIAISTSVSHACVRLIAHKRGFIFVKRDGPRTVLAVAVF